MALRTGLAAQLGVVDETTYGTPVTVSRFFDFNSESIKLDLRRIASSGIRANRYNRARSGAYGSHKAGAAGTVELEVLDKGFGFWLKHMLGAVATTGAGDPYTHTGSLGDLAGDSFTLQVGRPDVSGTVRAFTYHGGKVAAWTLACANDGLLVCSLDVDFEDEDTDTSLAVASYPSGAIPHVFTGGTITVGGSSADVLSMEVRGDNGLKRDRYFLRNSGLKKEPLQTGTELSGTLTAEFEGLTHYNRFRNTTEAAFTATFATSTSPAHDLVITLPLVRFDGETPSVGGTDVLQQSLPFVALDDGATIAYRTADSTP